MPVGGGAQRLVSPKVAGSSAIIAGELAQMSIRFLVGALLFLTLLLAAGCFAETQERVVTYENHSSMTLRITVDELALTTLQPGESAAFGTRKYLLPDHIRAYDDSGQLRFDKTIAWQDLKGTNFHVFIDTDELAPATSSPPES